MTAPIPNFVTLPAARLIRLERTQAGAAIAPHVLRHLSAAAPVITHRIQGRL